MTPKYATVSRFSTVSVEVGSSVGVDSHRERSSCIVGRGCGVGSGIFDAAVGPLMDWTPVVCVADAGASAATSSWLGGPSDGSMSSARGTEELVQLARITTIATAKVRNEGPCSHDELRVSEASLRDMGFQVG